MRSHDDLARGSKPEGPRRLPARRESRFCEADAPRGSGPHPCPDAVETAAELLANARFPLVITATAGRTRGGYAALASFAARHAIPVVQSQTRDLNLPTEHEMKLGHNVHQILPHADVILVLDNDVPWLPSLGGPAPGAKVIHMSADPLASRYPFREFETDILITSETTRGLAALDRAMTTSVNGKLHTGTSERRIRIGQIRDEQMRERQRQIETAGAAPRADGVWITHCLDSLKWRDAIVVNELGFNAPDFLELNDWGSYMATSLAGGLGFGLGAALGAKLAAPEREVIVCCGEGSYMFGNPTPYLRAPQQ